MSDPIVINRDALTIDDFALMIDFAQAAEGQLTTRDQLALLRKMIDLVKRVAGDDAGRLPMGQLNELVQRVIGAFAAEQSAGNSASGS